MNPSVPNVKYVRNRDTPSLLAMHMVSSIKSTIPLIKSNIIEIWSGVVKLTTKLTSPNLKPRKANYALTLSNESIVKTNTRWIVMNVHFENIGSTENGTSRSHKSSKKLG